MKKTLVAILIVSPILGFAQTTPRKSVEKQVQSQTSQIEVEAQKDVPWVPGLDTFTSQTIPKNFVGFSAKKIVNWIENALPKEKGEFEKQSEFEIRQLDVNRLIQGKVYAFSTALDNGGKIAYGKYDADSESYTSLWRDLGYVNELVPIETSNYDLGTYIGANAFGREVIVTKFLSESYGVGILVANGLLARSFGQMGSFNNLKIPISKARAINTNDIKFIFVGEIDSSTLYVKSTCIEAKIDSPQEGCFIGKYINILPTRIIAYIKSSGEILHEESLNEYTPTIYRVRHILVDSESAAINLIAKIRDGQQFEKVAKNYSIDKDSRDAGGDLGWKDPSTMWNELADVVKTLKRGEVANLPVKTPNGWHIIRVDDIKQ
jgi:parvulin-like peptidyl-prolyl isomerase